MKKNACYQSDIVDLKVVEIEPTSFFNRKPKSITFGIFEHGSDICVGECDIRMGMSEELYYAGHIGYRIYEAYRGNHYAYHACKVLLYIAKHELNFTSLFITCSPENIASYKTIQALQGQLVGIVNVPKYHWLYRRGEKVKKIYRILL